MAHTKISSTVFISLVLLWFLGIMGCQALNKIESGLGTPLCWSGWIVFIVLIFISVVFHPK